VLRGGLLRARLAVDRHAVLVEGRKQSEIVRITGYTREHIRRICRDYAERHPT